MLKIVPKAAVVCCRVAHAFWVVAAMLESIAASSPGKWKVCKGMPVTYSVERVQF
jgi:hypothetical protein